MISLNQETLAILRCPVTQTNLTIASQEQVDLLNQKIAGNEVVNRLGQSVTEPVEGLLVSADGSVGSAVRDGIVQMIADEAITMPANG